MGTEEFDLRVGIHRARLISIENLLMGWGVVFAKNGSDRQRRSSSGCPMCGGSDRFAVFRNNRWFCRACRESGDGIDLVRTVMKTSLHEALRYMAVVEREPDSLPLRKSDQDVSRETIEGNENIRRAVYRSADNLHENHNAVWEYLNGRGITRKTAETFLLGNSLGDGLQRGLVIPWLRATLEPFAVQVYLDRHARSVTGLRRSMHVGSAPKDGVFGEHLYRKQTIGILVEGEFDTMSLQQCNRNTDRVLVLGTSSSMSPKLDAFSTVDRWYSWTHADSGGERLARYMSTSYQANRIPPSSRDINELLVEGGDGIWDTIVRHTYKQGDLFGFMTGRS